jgi:mRNA interferase MazF
VISSGQIVLFRFPQTDQSKGKLRPALILCPLPGQYDDWLVCMISSQLEQAIPDFDETITPEDTDFKQSGLKLPSLIRISRIAVVSGDVLLGKVGQLDTQRLIRIRQKLSDWILKA